MGYKCMDCGSTEGFNAQREAIHYVTEYVTLDSEGYVCVEDEEYNNTEADSLTDIECGECDSGNVIWVDAEPVMTNTALTLKQLLKED